MIELPRRGRYDLHMHSARSDGQFEPLEVLERAVAGGLDVIALTDHDLTGALDPGVHRVGDRTIRVIAGAELTGQHEGREYHLLVYFPGDPPAAFHELCRAQVQARAARYDAAVSAMGLVGVDGAPVSAHRGELALTRHHLGRAIVAAGHASSVGDAIARFATREAVPNLDTPFVELIARARALGAVTSWAHPPAEAMRAYTGTFAAAGLHGLEGLRPGLRREDRNLAKKLARTHRLLLTGGSDWHGWGSSIKLGLFGLRGEDLDAFRDALAA